MTGFNEIKRLVDRDQFIISNHARTRMFQRNITTDMIIKMIAGGEVIEEYPDDFPCPSVLVLGYSNEQPLHIGSSRTVRRSCTNYNSLQAG